MNYKNVAALLALTACASFAHAGEYVCKVYCKTNGGSIEPIKVNVTSDSRGSAASYVDGKGHEVCRANGYASATSSTMSDSQCQSK